MKHMTVGADIAKNVMQLHYIDAETGEIVNKPVKRAVFLEHFANRAPCLIGMEACGGSQYWARTLTAMGHEVKLMPEKFVKAFVMGNKNDAVDAKAIWLAVQHAERSVAVKTETQQAVLGLHGMREQLVKFRTMQINGLRGLLTETDLTLNFEVHTSRGAERITTDRRRTTHVRHDRGNRELVRGSRGVRFTRI
ncbi:hypothetical protein BCC0191_004228 [Burkholderia ambifaria]